MGKVEGFDEQLEDGRGVWDRVAGVDYDDKRWVDLETVSEYGVWER